MAYSRSGISDTLWTAFGIGLVSAFSLPLGALTSFFWRPESRVVAALMAFGAGALLAALTIDLVAPMLGRGHYTGLFPAFLCGGLLLIALNQLINDLGGFRLKISTSVHHCRRETRRRLKQVLGHLERTPLAHRLSAAEFRELAGDIEPRFYPVGSQMYRAGDPADVLYVVVDGEVEIEP